MGAKGEEKNVSGPAFLDDGDMPWADCLPQTHRNTSVSIVAAAGRGQGKVTLRVTLDAEGNITKAEVADVAHQANPVLQESAIDNIKRWTFEKPLSAPFTLVIVYEYKMDGSLPQNDHQNPITKVNFDLPDHVTILHNESVVNPQGGKKPKSSAP